MIELVADMPPGTVGFRVRGRIEREDYENVLTPELHRAAEGGQLRSLYVVEDLSQMDPGAVWEDSKLGLDLGLRHRDAFVRTAVVTDTEWMARAANMFAWMIPGEVGVFPLVELEPAKAWVAGG